MGRGITVTVEGRTGLFGNRKLLSEAGIEAPSRVDSRIGSDIAKESADVVLIGNDLGKLVDTLRIARCTRTISWKNFAGTIGVDALGIALRVFGFLNPLLAAFIHVG